MVKGSKVQQIITVSVDEVMERTNGGYDIFRYYLGNVGRIMQRPWGNKEKKLSWGLFPKNGIWMYKDQASEEVGNALHFVQKYFGLSFTDTMNKVCFDFGISAVNNVVNVKPVVIDWEKPDMEKDFTIIDPILQKFGKRHHEFWNSAEVSEDHCNKYNCFAVKSLKINHKYINLRREEIAFAYYAPDEQGWKIYFPERPESKFRNNVSGHYLWNYSNVGTCDNLIIQKSMKDLIVTTMITPCVIATQNESAGIFDEEMVGKINSITKTPWVWYGSDWDGVKKCKKITDTNKWRYINTPKNLLPEINDAYGYVQKFGLKAMEEFMKSKKLL